MNFERYETCRMFCLLASSLPDMSDVFLLASSLPEDDIVDRIRDLLTSW